MKLCSSDNHYTTVPIHGDSVLGMVVPVVVSVVVFPFGDGDFS